MNVYQKMIDRALEHVRSQQSPDGSFANLSGISPTNFSDAVPRRTTFFTSNILTCLQNIPDYTTDMRTAAAKFLLSEKNERWSFNYWARDGIALAARTESPYPPYPDDLDDTFAALAALARHDSAVVDGHAFSAIAQMLTARETQQGGPYRTWLVPKDAPARWHDVDLVVNSTIARCLLLLDVRLPNVELFISDAVRQDRLASPYYPGIFHVGYFLSRFYEHSTGKNNFDARSKLSSIISNRLGRTDRQNITVLEYAMAVSSLIRLGCTDQMPQETVGILLDRLEREGFLPYAFCIDPTHDGKRCYAGASALTAAFCAEALAQYLSHTAPITLDICRTPTIHDHIRSLARAACRSMDPELRRSASGQIEKLADERITMLAYEFNDALYRNGKVIPSDIVEQLSLANLYGWMAYEIYDDALDGEGESYLISYLIPCANFFLRTLTKIYSTLEMRIPGIGELFDKTMNRIDNANMWEQKYCRPDMNAALPYELPIFGNHRMLADRSIGHAMGPLAELLAAGYAADSEEYKSVESFFRHYLIARQLHDDAHDWADDLLHGHVNSVGPLVLTRYREKYSAAPNATMLKNALPVLRALFWEEVIDVTAHTITVHVSAARQARQKSSVLDGVDFMESALRTLESGARRAIKERDEALLFLNDYRASRHLA